MTKKHDKPSMYEDEYINQAIESMNDPKKIDFAKDFINTRLFVVSDDGGQEIHINKISEYALIFFVYSVIEDWESTSK